MNIVLKTPDSKRPLEEGQVVVRPTPKFRRTLGCWLGLHKYEARTCDAFCLRCGRSNKFSE